MREVTSAQDFVDSLLNAGDKLVIVDFFSPGCGGCKALHPKVIICKHRNIHMLIAYYIWNLNGYGVFFFFFFWLSVDRVVVFWQICQFAEMNPDVLFLHVNYEEHKSMCYSLNIHVLPFFRFYRGAQGRLCSFSCTNATVSFAFPFSSCTDLVIAVAISICWLNLLVLLLNSIDYHLVWLYRFLDRFSISSLSSLLGSSSNNVFSWSVWSFCLFSLFKNYHCIYAVV